MNNVYLKNEFPLKVYLFSKNVEAKSTYRGFGQGK